MLEVLVDCEEPISRPILVLDLHMNNGSLYLSTFIAVSIHVDDFRQSSMQIIATLSSSMLTEFIFGDDFRDRTLGESSIFQPTIADTILSEKQLPRYRR